MLLIAWSVYALLGAFLFVYIVWHAWHDIQRMTNRGMRKYLFVTLAGHDQPMMFRRDILAKAQEKLYAKHVLTLTGTEERQIAAMLAAEFGLVDGSFDMLIYVAAVQNPKIRMLMPHVL